MALSNKTGALVLTTGNKSEMAVGYCTLYGDMAGGFAVIKDIAKTLNRLKAERNFSMVVSEQVLWFTLEIADRFLIIEKGEFVYEETKERVDTAKIHAFLTV